MSITFDLPPEIEAQLRALPNLDQRVLSFLRRQVEHERWRTGRYSEQARSVLSEGLDEAARLQKMGVSREEMFEELLAVLDGPTR